MVDNLFPYCNNTGYWLYFQFVFFIGKKYSLAADTECRSSRKQNTTNIFSRLLAPTAASTSKLTIFQQLFEAFLVNSTLNKSQNIVNVDVDSDVDVDVDVVRRLVPRLAFPLTAADCLTGHSITFSFVWTIPIYWPLHIKNVDVNSGPNTK